MSENTPLLHSVNDSSQRLNVSPSSIWRLIRRGELRTVKILGRTLVPESELQRIAQPKDEPTLVHAEPLTEDGRVKPAPKPDDTVKMPMVRGSHKYL
jgi:hypothetical protein